MRKKKLACTISRACLGRGTWSAPPTPTQLPAGLKQFSPFQMNPSNSSSMQHDTLSHNANLHLWGKKASDTCPLCHADNQNLVHVLNLCQVALNLRHYNDRHGSVLTVLYATISQYLPESVSSTVDLDNQYVFPSHIVSTDLRPDIVWWSDKDQSVCLMELTVFYDTLFHEARPRRKTNTWTSSLLFTMQGTMQSWSQSRWDHEASPIWVVLKTWGKTWNWQKLRPMTLWSKQLGEQCWALLVPGAEWMKDLYDYLKAKPEIIVKGFKGAGTVEYLASD